MPEIRVEVDHVFMSTNSPLNDSEPTAARGEPIVCTGWAFAIGSDSTIGMDALIDGREADVTVCRTSRRDVAEHFSRPDLIGCGFRLEIGTEDLRPGMHELVLQFSDEWGSAVRSGVILFELTEVVPFGRMRTPRVLVAAAPKSGCTFVARVLGKYYKVDSTRASFPSNVEHMLGSDVLEQLEGKSWVLPMHMWPRGQNLANLRRHRIETVVTWRNLADAIVSFDDHLQREWEGFGGGPEVYLGRRDLWNDTDVQQRYKFLIHNMLPWYVGFYRAWRDMHAPTIMAYERLAIDPIGYFTYLIQRLSGSVDEAWLRTVLENARVGDYGTTRFNVGRNGRAVDAMTDETKALLEDVLQAQIDDTAELLLELPWRGGAEAAIAADPARWMHAERQRVDSNISEPAIHNEAPGTALPPEKQRSDRTSSLLDEAMTHFEARRTDIALRLLDRVVQEDPSAARIHYNRARVLLDLDRLPEALDAARQAIAIGGQERPLAHYVVGEILARKDRTLRQAAAEFATAALLRPNWAEACFRAGVSYSNCGDCVQAEHWGKAALEIRADYPEALWLVARSLLEQDRPGEALAYFERMYAVAPNARGLREEIEKLRAPISRANRIRPARHPRLVSEYEDFEAFAEKHVLGIVSGIKPFLTRESKVFTAGSCFAVNIANGLKVLGIDTATVGVPEEINSTFANRYLFDWILCGPTEGTQTFQEFFSEEKRLHFRDSLSAADVVVISLGVAPCYFDRKTGAFAFTIGSHFYSQEHVFRTTTVRENVENIKAIIALLQSLNPAVRIVLTVSPVPLKGTFEMQSAVVADCVSKSTLRVAAHDVASALPDRVIYWPSFELVRWYGAHVGPVFGNDDESAFHVSEDLVLRICRMFVRRFSVEEASCKQM